MTYVSANKSLNAAYTLYITPENIEKLWSNNLSTWYSNIWDESLIQQTSSFFWCWI